MFRVDEKEYDSKIWSPICIYHHCNTLDYDFDGNKCHIARKNINNIYHSVRYEKCLAKSQKKVLETDTKHDNNYDSDDDDDCDYADEKICRKYHSLGNILIRDNCRLYTSDDEIKQVLTKYKLINNHKKECCQLLPLLGHQNICQLVVIEEVKDLYAINAPTLNNETNIDIRNLLNFYIYAIINMPKLKKKFLKHNVFEDINSNNFLAVLLKNILTRAPVSHGVIKNHINQLNGYAKYYEPTDHFDTQLKITNNADGSIKVNTESHYYPRNDILKLAKLIEKIMTPVNYMIEPVMFDINQLNLVSYKLFQYQIHTIFWMISLERHGYIHQYKYLPNYQWNNIKLCYYDMRYEQQVYIDTPNFVKLRLNGGCLIDEVGLGKTIDITCLALLNSFIKDNPDYLCSRATLIVCPNHLCGQWYSELVKTINPKTNVNPKIVKLFTKTHFNKCTYDDLLHAKFVVTSFNFMKNKAYLEQMNSKLRVFYGGRYVGLKSALINFDAVRNCNLFDYLDILRKVAKNTIITTQTQPLLYLINWHRVVVDEFHLVTQNVGNYRDTFTALLFLKSSYRWCVSGTPFSEYSDLEEQISFLADDASRKIIPENSTILFENTNTDVSTIYRRNTKQSITQEFTLPPIHEEINMLEFTPVERTLYDANAFNNQAIDYANDRNVYLRQLCCHPNIATDTKTALASCKTLDDIERNMIEFHRDETKNMKKKIKKQQHLIDVVQIKLAKLGVDFDIRETKINKQELKDDPELVEIKNIDEEKNLNNQQKIEKLQQRMVTLLDNCSKYEKEYICRKNRQNYFINVLDRLRQKKFGECSICLSEIVNKNAGVTNCGHIFCYSCLLTTVNTNHKCPSCNRHLVITDICKLKPPKEEKKKITKEKCSEKSKLINSVGTKVANLILYLRKSKEKTIIFSQWDNLLLIIGDMLKANKIKTVFCRGSCYQRNSSIVKFNNDEKIRVIMLSSSYAASGSNLTKATKIIFIEPVYGDYTFRKNVEEQAIARAHRLGQKKPITVVRFIISNTIEEQIIKENAEQDKKHQQLEEEKKE